MAWDLGRAMHKKQEAECARLLDFEFRLRARTMRLLAAELDMPETTLVAAIAEGPDEMILDQVAARRGETPEQIRVLHARLQTTARAQLVDEIGDPGPHRMA